MKYSILGIVFFIIAIPYWSYSQVDQLSITINYPIASFDISTDSRYIFISDEQQKKYVYDIQKRSFTAEPQAGSTSLYRSFEMNGRPTGSPTNRYTIWLKNDSVLILNRERKIHTGYKLARRDYNYAYSKSGKYFLILQNEVFYNKSDAGIKVINLETGRLTIDTGSYVKNKRIQDAVNNGIPGPFEVAGREKETGIKYGNGGSLSKDTLIQEYTRNGKKGLYKTFTQFKPEFADVNKEETRLVISGSERFWLVNIETGAPVFERKDDCKLAKITPDGRLVVSAHGNVLSFYDAQHGAALFSTVDRNNTKGYKQKDLSYTDMNEVITDMQRNSMPRNKAINDLIDKQKATYAKLNKKDKEKFDKIMDSIRNANLNTVTAMYEKAGFIPSEAERESNNQYVQIKQASFNPRGTHVIIGYAEFSNNKINSLEIDHSINPVYFNILDLNTGQMMGNADWKSGRLTHAEFNNNGKLLLVSYTKGKTSFVNPFVKSFAEVWNVEHNKMLYPVSSNLLLDTEHELFFSKTGEFIIVTNKLKYSGGVLKWEIFNAGSGKRVMHGAESVGYDDKGILFLPEVNVLVACQQYSKTITVYDLTTGQPVLGEYTIPCAAQDARISVSQYRHYLFIHKSNIVSTEPERLILDLKKHVFVADDKAFDQMYLKSNAFVDRTGTFSMQGFTGDVPIFKRDTMINQIHVDIHSYRNPTAPVLDFQVAGNDLYYISKDDYSRSCWVTKVSDFANRSYKVTVIGNSQFKKFDDIVGCNGARNVFAEANNGDLNFYSVDDGKPLYHLRMINEKDFIIWNEKKEYMSSSNQLTKRYKGLEQMELDKNKPDVILQLIGSTNKDLIATFSTVRKERAERTLGNLENPIKGTPGVFSVSIKAVSDSVKTKRQKLVIALRVTDPVNNLKSMNVWVKNTPVWGIRGLHIARRKIRQIDTIINIDLSSGNNVIEFAAQNEAGKQSSEYMEITYSPKKIDEPKVFFIGVGICRYDNSRLKDLIYADNDVRELALLFKQRYPQINLDTFIDKSATNKNIMAAKDGLLHTNVEDIVIFYLSGHGKWDSTSNVWRFVTYGNTGKAGFTGLTFDEIESMMDGIAARKKLLIIDACYSGELPKNLVVKKHTGEIKHTTDENSPLPKGDSIEIAGSGFDRLDLMATAFSDLNKGSGAQIIASSKGNQESGQYPELKHGLLTYFLIKKITDHQNATDKAPLTVGELRDYIIKETTRYSNGLQQPVSRQENYEFNWTIW